MDQQPKIPTLKDAQKPQVKIKGMGAGLTLFDRLKQFKKKDLAFILAGLGTLFMAPLAEHFMMAPENGDASLQQGWGKGGTSGGFFGSGSSPYESGSHMASGGAIGGSGDIITPLNVRDPSSLVMGPGGTQQPPAGSAAPAAPPPTSPSRSDEDYKDALKGAASRAASAAVKKAPLPVPKVALGGSGLRGLGVAAGGSSASGGSLPVGPAAGSVGGGGGGGLRLVRNTPGFKGVAGSRSPTGGTGLDNTKRAGANAGDAFNRAGSAAAGLNAAASETIPTGGQGFGGGGHGGVGANDKPYSGSGPGGSKSVGESLAFLRAKQRQEEELKLEFEKRKLKDPELLLYGIRNDVLKAMAGKVGESLTKHVTGFLDPSSPSDMLNCGGIKVPKSVADSQKCTGSDGKGGVGTDTACYKVGGDGGYTFIPAKGEPIACTGAAADGKKEPETEGNGMSELNAGIGSVCTNIGSLRQGGGVDSGYNSYLQGTVLPAAKNAEIARNTLVPGGDLKCGTPAITGDTASKMLSDAKAKLYAAAAAAGADGNAPAATDALGLIKSGALKPDDVDAKAAGKALVDAEALIGTAEGKIKEAETTLGAALPPATQIGVDVATFKGVTEDVNKVRTAHTQATDIITSLRRSAESLKAGIRSIEPLVKGAEQPVGALPDQNSLNKASAALAAEAGADPLVASAVQLPEVKGDVVAEQTPAKAALSTLQAAVNKAASTAATAKTAPTAETTKAAEDAKKEMTDKLEEAKAPMKASQDAVVAQATGMESSIRTIAIRGGTQ